MQRLGKICIALLIALYAVVVLHNAWMGDDAYITFRTIDNWVNGYGLTWNVGERVQAYTHPLWMLLLALFYLFTREPYWTTLAVSLALSVGTAIIFAYKIARNILVAMVGLTALILSAAYIDYSTSGLENPLTHFLLVIFLYLFFHDRISLSRFFYMCVVASLGLVNRLDTALLYGPFLIYAFWQVRGREAFYGAVIGFIPLMLWEGFALFYYGFPFPNTAYAKLNTGLPQSYYLVQGWNYLVSTLHNDPLTIVIIVFAILIPLLMRHRKILLASAAIFLYIVYILKIGGCFMAGRYLSAPFLIAVVALTYTGLFKRLRWSIPAAAVIITLGIMLDTSPMNASNNENIYTFEMDYGIADERSCYAPTHAPMNYKAEPAMQHEWAAAGLVAKEYPDSLAIFYAMGLFGYYAGPEVTVLDRLALTDPLLARLPTPPGVQRRIGHFPRVVPAGYMKTLESGVNSITDPYLHEYYDNLSVITRGPLFSTERLAQMWNFNLGYYNYLLEAYGEPHLMKVELEQIDRPKGAETLWMEPGNFVISEAGIEIDMERVRHDSLLEISYDQNDRPTLTFSRGDHEVGSLKVTAQRGNSGWLMVRRVPVPEEAVASGYDKIRIVPEAGDGMYAVGHLRILDDGS